MVAIHQSTVMWRVKYVYCTIQSANIDLLYGLTVKLEGIRTKGKVDPGTRKQRNCLGNYQSKPVDKTKVTRQRSAVKNVRLLYNDLLPLRCSIDLAFSPRKAVLFGVNQDGVCAWAVILKCVFARYLKPTMITVLTETIDLQQ
ncbi:hypothetical protein TNCT_606771 [Trichonephila clavata]|uniref:Uncharacterized protein n=1 Tax=Trichonephila clavata TaxID=2740835 RepID=A0A8X6GMW5_TRICU|nr:hypothetical protein TNCT_606771 [Trichonephila clavata]